MTTLRPPNKPWDTLVADRTVTLWVRCGQHRIMAVVQDDPVAVVFRGHTPHIYDIRLVNGKLIDRRGSGWIKDGKLKFMSDGLMVDGVISVGCVGHGSHEVSATKLEAAIHSGRKSIEITAL